MKLQCSWCEEILGTVPGPEDGITHTICDSCDEKCFGQHLTEKQRLIRKEIRQRNEAARSA